MFKARNLKENNDTHWYRQPFKITCANSNIIVNDTNEDLLMIVLIEYIW